MNENEIPLEIEEEPRFTLDSEGDTNIYSFAHVPQYGLLAPEPGALLIPAMSMAAFNPSSLEFINRVKVGDLIQTTSDPNHPVYKAWNPPPEYQVEQDFQMFMRVRLVATDAMGYPVIVCDQAV